MENPLLITKDFSTKRITIERLFDAPKEEIWHAHIGNAVFRKWGEGSGCLDANKSLGFCEGGHWHYGMTSSDSAQIWGWFDYVKITPKENLIVRNGISSIDGSKNTSTPSNKWLIRFQNEGEKTRVTIELGFETIENMQKVANMDFEASLGDMLETLDAFTVA